MRASAPSATRCFRRRRLRRRGDRLHGLHIPFLAASCWRGARRRRRLRGRSIVLRRATGIQLAVLTLALSQLALLLVSYTKFLGRDDGLSGLARPRSISALFVLDLTSQTAFYYFILAVCASSRRRSSGWCQARSEGALLAVRIDSERAAFLGIDVRRQRLIAFTLAGAIAAFAGALAAPWTQIVSTDSMSWLTSAQPMLATLLGGAGSFWGPVIGAFALTMVNYVTRTFAGLSELMVGGVLLAVVMLAPSGIAGPLGRLRARRRNGRSVARTVQ